MLNEFEKCKEDFYYFLDNYIKPDNETLDYIELIKYNTRIQINKENKKAIEAMYICVIYQFLFSCGSIGILAKTLLKASKYNLNIYAICKTLPDFLFDKKYHERQSKYLHRTRENSLNFSGIMPDYSAPFIGYTHLINIVDFKGFSKIGIEETLVWCLIHEYCSLNNKYYRNEDVKIFIFDEIPEEISVNFREKSYSTVGFYRVGYNG